MKSIFPLFLIFVLVGCGPASTTEKENLVKQIEKAHQKDEFLSKKAIEFNINLSFGGKERLNAKMTLLTNSTKGLLELNDSSKIYYTNEKVYHSPNLKNEKGVRFDAYTWSYFMLFPYKLSDEGTNWSAVEELKLADKNYNTQKLTFGQDIGDAPDDWYLVYSNPKTKIIEYAAYIVTAKKTVQEAEADPHAIQYTNYKTVNGVPLATEWVFWGWTKDKGLSKELGKATLSNFKFIAETDGLFNAPSGYIEK